MKIVFLDGYTMQSPDNALKKLEALGELTVYDRTSYNEIIDRAMDADVLIVNKTAIDAKVILQLPKLKLICVAATGYDKIDVATARAQNIPVCNCAGYSSTAVAQMALSLLLEAADNVGFYTEQNHKGEWNACEDFCYTTRPRIDLSNKKAAIVGFGSIGSTLAHILQQLGVKVYTVSSKSQADLPVRVTKISLIDAFKDCDIVSLNCPLDSNNKEFVNADLLKVARKGLILINTARGGLINETDVAAALNNDILGAYCTDVLTQEPPQDNCPILHAKNTYITPHIGWKTSETVKRIVDMVTDNIISFTQGKPKSVVN